MLASELKEACAVGLRRSHRTDDRRCHARGVRFIRDRALAFQEYKLRYGFKTLHFEVSPLSRQEP